ncbi:MAG: DUF362 domain-containing protein [bacterium]|nr:DUF362 domain-containing protein [bacterium]
MKSKVYFIKDITPSNMVKIYQTLGHELKGKIGVKVHTGEDGNQNFLKPEFMKDIIDYVSGTVIECNTAYEGERDTTEKHLKLIEKHGWTKYYTVDILDENGEIELKIPNGKKIKKNYIGKNIVNYDSLLVISHFKGHPMGGYGAALKNISIGLASAHGKAYIHGVGKVEEKFTADHNSFLESMADAASSIMEYKKDKIVFINVMANMSVDCDCCKIAEDPKIKDIGILASLDPVALDQACIDLVFNSKDEGKKDLIERITSRNGTHTIDVAEQLQVGTKEYTLINI